MCRSMASDAQPTRPRVSVIVVSYNTAGHLRSCLAALTAAGSGAFEVIVVDNASHDGSPEMVAAEFPGVVLIRNTKNVGFGAANNQGLDAMAGDVALLLNSDARPEPGAVARLAETMVDKGVVACGGALRFPDGRPQGSACSRLTLWRVFCEQAALEKVFKGSRFFNGYWLNNWLPENRDSEVEQVMGACLMLRPVERFDERFFLYCEDTELCLRLRRNGKILFVPSAVFVHELGASSAASRWQSIARYSAGKELYFAIHHGKLASAACWLINRMGALMRFAVYGLAFRRTQAGLWWRVLTAPRSGPPRPPDSV